MPAEFLIVTASLTGVLSFASATCFVLRARRADSADILNLSDRIRSWWWIMALLAGAAASGTLPLTFTFAVLSFLALREFVTVTSVIAADRHTVLVCFLVCIPAQFTLAAVGWMPAFTLLLPVGGLLLIPLLTALSGETSHYLSRTAELYFSMLICVYGISYVPALLNVSASGTSGHQLLLVVFLLVIAQSSDVFQYVCGRLWGHRLLAPTLSPSKTVEGLIGGVACATALGAALWRITPYSPLQAALAALVIALAGIAGGLVMSAIKRDRGIKDWSHLIPGHGGVLDRLDSLCFSAPLFFYLTRSLVPG